MDKLGIYKFMGKNYKDEKSFGKALAYNFPDAINYIFTPEFKACFKDPYLWGRISVEIARCKYKESAFTMVVYLLNPDLGLCVKGKFFNSVYDLALYVKEQDGMQDFIEHLFVDNVISSTFFKYDQSELKKDVIYIENNISDPAIKEYFVDLFDQNFPKSENYGLSIYDFYLYPVSKAKDPFEAFLDLIDNPKFKACLFKTFGVNEVLDVYNTVEKPFKIIRLLLEKSAYHELNPLINPILNSGFDLYVCKNYDSYQYKSVAKELLDFFKDYLKTYNDKSFNEQVDYREQLYLKFINFIRLLDCGLIVPNEPNADVTKVYNNKRYSNNFLLSLDLVYQEELQLTTYSNKQKKATVSGIKEEIKVTNKNEKALKRATLQKELEMDFNRYHKHLVGRKAIAILSLAMGILGLVVALLTYTLHKVPEWPKYGNILWQFYFNLTDNFAVPYIGSAATGCSVLLIVLAVVLLLKNQKALSLLDANFSNKTNAKYLYETEKVAGSKLYKKTFYHYGLLAGVLYFFLAMVIGIFSFAAVQVFDLLEKWNMFGWWGGLLDIKGDLSKAGLTASKCFSLMAKGQKDLNMLYLLVIPGVSLVLSFVGRKKKFWYFLLTLAIFAIIGYIACLLPVRGYLGW